MKHKTSELEGALLDAAVAKAEGFPSFFIAPGSDDRGEACVLGPCRAEDSRFDWRPSTAWEHGGPIIHRERIDIEFTDKPHKRPNCCATVNSPDDGAVVGYGDTPLIAAMRAFVASKFGDEVELP